MTSLGKTVLGALAIGLAVIAASATAVAQPAANKNITLMVGVKGDPFYVSMQCGAQAAATKLGYKLQVQGPDKFDATLQNPMLDADLERKFTANCVPVIGKEKCAAVLETVWRFDEARELAPLLRLLS